YSFGDGAPDRVYSFTPATTGKYVVVLDADWDSALSIATDCNNYAATCIAGNEKFPLSQPEALVVDLTANTNYSIIVDGYEAGQFGPYTLAVEAAPTVGDTCATAIPVNSLPFTHSTMTYGYSSDYGYTAGSCPGVTSGWGSGSNDVVYALTPTVTGSYHIEVDNAFDATVYVVTDCSAVNTTCVAGADDCTTACSEELDVNMTAGTTYYVVVDGYGNSSNIA